MKFLNKITRWSVAFALLTNLGLAQQPAASPIKISTTATTVSSREGLVFDARIVAPNESQRNGFGVLMLGGGLGNDLNWTTPGFVEESGRRTQLTINGKPHADAPLIAEALATRGFVVMHFSTIRQDDPKRNAWPNEMTVYSHRELLQFSTAALDAFRSKNLFAQDNVILLGHSLGAERAANLAANDTGIAALVLLAPASLTRTTAEDRGPNQNREDAAQFIQLVDTNNDAVAGPSEYALWQKRNLDSHHPLAGQTFAQLDFHADGALVDWEVSAGLARHHRSSSNFEGSQVSNGLARTEDILRTGNLKTLVIYGTRDGAQAHHAPILSDLIRDEQLEVQLQMLPGIGHQLGPTEKNRHGPISLPCREAIANWLTREILPSTDHQR